MDPLGYSVELRNRYFDKVSIITKYSKDLSWEYAREGGYGRGSILLAMDYDALQNLIGPDYDVQIFVETNGLIFRGYVDGDTPTVNLPDGIKVSLYGYMGQLQRVRVLETYTGQEVSVIVEDILDTYIVPNTKITYDAADIETTPYTPDSLVFDCMADEAIKTLAALAGNYEWGVDRNRKFFFKVKTNEVKHYLKYKIDVQKYEAYNDYSKIINRLYIKGGSSFTATVSNSESIASYGLREKIVSNSSITTSAVAQRYGSMVLADEARIHRRATINLINTTRFMENTTPIGRFKIVGEDNVAAKKYGAADAIYGTFKYGGGFSLEINKIDYHLRDEAMDISINAGFTKPDIANQIKRLENDIQQIRNA